ncbi:Influenza virus NS1A-binding [Nymphon striatum]|nr:Influenza virus NS1A-binding [Nymphon striatum]
MSDVAQPITTKYIDTEMELEEEIEVKEEESEKKIIFEDGNHLHDMLDGLNKLRKKKQFCDLVLQVGNQEIQAHRAVLACASPYLFDLISLENESQLQRCRLNGDFNREAFNILVEYAYTSKLVIPPDSVKSVYMAASKLKMEYPARVCGVYLTDDLTASNCIGIRSIRGITFDRDLIAKVDSYISTNIDDVIKSEELLALPSVQVEVIQNSLEEIKATNDKRLCNLVLDWIKSCVENDELSVELLHDKIHMLFLNKDRKLHDCNEIKKGDQQDTDMIQDYKKMSQRIPGRRVYSSSKIISCPAMPRQFLYGRSPSASSLSSLPEAEENDWKLIAVARDGDNRVVALVTLNNELSTLSVAQRLNTPTNTPNDSCRTSIENGDGYVCVAPMNFPRCGLGAGKLWNKLLVCGGYDRGECLRTVEMYEPKTNTWEALRSMREPRGRFNTTVIKDKLYAVGGCNGMHELNSVECLDGETSVWKRLQPLPVPRSYAGVCELNGKLYCIGGWNGQTGIKRCDVYDPNTDKWTEIASLQNGRSQVGVTAFGGYVYAVGGCHSWHCMNSVERYDPEEDSWTYVASLNTSRRGCGVAVHQGILYAIGGSDGSSCLFTCEIYDENENVWKYGPNLTSSRANLGVAVIENTLYAVGGFSGKSFLNTIEFLDDANEWTTFIPKKLELPNGSS